MAVAVAAAGAAAALEAFVALEAVNNLVMLLVQQVIANALAPEMDALQAASWTLTPGRRLSPADAAVAQVKGHLAASVAADEARAGGIAGDRFAVMVAAAGNPPPADFLLQMARRGIIPIADGKGAESVSAEQGIRESFLHNKWLDVLEQGQWALPGLGAVIEARLRNFITPAQFNTWTHYLGLKDDAANLEFLAAGVPISPQEGYAAYHRGLIPFDSPDPNVPSLKQVFRESRIIDKYVDVWVGLQQYIPPPRTTTALLREGAITEAQAAKWFADAGLAPETVAAYVHSAHRQRTAATHELAKAEILALRTAHLVTDAQAQAFLEAEGWAKETIAYEFEVADLREHGRQLSGVLGRIRSLYIAHKITKDEAMAALTDLGLEPASRDAQLAAWAVAARNNVAVLTPAQIGSLVKLQWFSFDTGVGLLEGHGYSTTDAALFLVEHLKIQPGDPSAPPGLSPQ